MINHIQNAFIISGGSRTHDLRENHRIGEAPETDSGAS